MYDVGSSRPGGEEAPKGLAVRQLKWYASWVQNVVRQFGPYQLSTRLGFVVAFGLRKVRRRLLRISIKIIYEGLARIK